MKIGTLSLNINTDDLNYGAMLHSWAFLEYLKKRQLADNVEVIDYTTQQLENFQKNSPVCSYIRMHRWRSALKLLISVQKYKNRQKKFENFIKTYMHVSKESYTQATLEKTKLEYDCLICESDVIWSPRFYDNGKFDATFFCALGNMTDKRKIIYAASTANANFNKEELDVFRKLIQFPDYVSCRERYGTEIIKLCGRQDVETVIDPVLLLEKQDYEKIIAERMVRDPYLLIYIPLNYDRRYQSKARNYAKKHNLKIVEISYYTFHSISHEVIADAGIEEFLSLIKYAEAVFTNSFHAVCFCCLFHKEFYAFSRKTGRKTEDLCKRLGLNENYVSIDDFHERERIDFDKVDTYLRNERKRSEEWLESVIRG